MKRNKMVTLAEKIVEEVYSPTSTGCTGILCSSCPFNIPADEGHIYIDGEEKHCMVVALSHKLREE